ncbi:hypothetical protein [Glycomyces buryatensis]|uniref:DUF4878 domain-containing protein n=1 Tax=Glycomyces buryatensis TaxID=2570927 RepID=A0A4S8QNW9_9ACTN|nr:hypothetical protein [Glycomyces buryatensis]THV42404.1 hypothetical protein FAB82_07055 [Glycomyces buryatensis]
MVARRIQPQERRRRHWPDAPLRSSTRRILALVIALALTAGVAVVVGRWTTARGYADEPVETVRAFLEASRDGNVDTALAIALDEPTGRTDFIAPDAISGDWEITELGLHVWSPDSGSAVVLATITGPEATAVTEAYELDRVDGAWRIENAFAELEISQPLLPYFELNGHSVPVEPDAGVLSFSFLPGVYQPYRETSPDILESHSPPVIVLGDTVFKHPNDETPMWGDQFFNFAITIGAEDAVNERLAAYLDDCLSAEDGPERFGCPFGLPDHRVNDHFGGEGDDFEKSWEITTYPRAAVTSLSGVITSPEEMIFATREPGTARLTATDADTGEEAVIDCDIPLAALYPYFGADGGFGIGPNEDPEGESSGKASWWSSDFDSGCEGAE